MVASDTPQTLVAACKGSCSQSCTYGYGSANPDRLTYYLPLGSSARTRRRAACTTAVWALSRRSCVRYSRAASGCDAFHRSGKNPSVLSVPRSMCVTTLSKYIPASRSILSAMATSDITLALRTSGIRLPMSNQLLCHTAFVSSVGSGRFKGTIFARVYGPLRFGPFRTAAQ